MDEAGSLVGRDLSVGPVVESVDFSKLKAHLLLEVPDLQIGIRELLGPLNQSLLHIFFLLIELSDASLLIPLSVSEITHLFLQLLKLPDIPFQLNNINLQSVVLLLECPDYVVFSRR